MKCFTYTQKLVVALLVMMSLSACQSAPQSLYQRVGEQAGLERLVDAFINQIGQDDVVFHYFKQTNVSHFRTGFVSHLCDVLDGPCQYDGDSMVQIHTGMNINEHDFNHVVDLLIAAMDEVGIAHPVQNQILAKLAPMRSEIIKI
ncbi:group 1 truncated hemoglobin [Pseudoalteromonas sp. MMG022]|uniref:group I truncated hemoglobin n=1 Tax=Pseudoalteromonas sp. MMG022 TaxID=2909978 RepID=UPI001F4848C1|nr:group 1 truncated hemoglobin [Pseudoalteromonas sp. MMG022]MCF6435568.1 group 1 truncated hemoglobin [Pseudoalteromonas sp. MMG022]